MQQGIQRCMQAWPHPADLWTHLSSCRNQHCRLVQEGKDCSQGLRLRHHYMLCGALLRVWGRIAAVMADVSSSSYLQIVRLKTKDKKKQVGEWTRWAAGAVQGSSWGAADPRCAPNTGIKIPEGCVRRVLQELRVMDADVKRRSTREPDLPARPPTPRLTLPCGPCEVLDLTYSPPAEAFPPPQPPRFAFPPPPPDPGTLLLGAQGAMADPESLAHQGCDINFREVLEDMLRSLHAGPTEPPGPLGAGAAGGGGPERQSVIQFSPPFSNS
jgi:hypothetical protein